MRTRARIDANQVAIVKALRGIGASVRSLAQLGGGVPDLLVGRRGVTLILEIKNGSKPASETRLTPDEQKFVNEWAGQWAKVTSPEGAVQYVLENT